MSPAGSNRGGAGGREIEVRLDPADFRRLMRDVRGFDAALAKATRARLRAAGSEGVKDVQRRLMGRTYHIDAGLARGLAAGTKLSIRAAGISIRTTGAKLPPGKQAMVRAYDKPSFRHPVRGNRQVWVTQRGRPYFGAVLMQRHRTMLAAMEQALADAAATIRAGRVQP